MISNGNVGDSGGLLHSSDLFHPPTKTPHIQITFYTFFILLLGALVVIQALYNPLYNLIIAINLFGFETVFRFHQSKVFANITSVNSLANRRGFVLLP